MKKKSKQFAENYIRDQIQGMYDILEQSGFIIGSKPSSKGLNTCYIHELPCLVFSDVYEKFNKLHSWNTSELAMYLSCFYDLKVKEDFKTYNPPFLKQELKYTEETMNTYIENELKYNVYVTCQYSLQYDLMIYIKKWIEEVHDVSNSISFFDTLKQEIDVFIGDFMKCCMKIVNMCNELIIYGTNDANYGFVEKIQQIQKQIQKNIVINQSFYL